MVEFPVRFHSVTEYKLAYIRVNTVSRIGADMAHCKKCPIGSDKSEIEITPIPLELKNCFFLLSTENSVNKNTMSSKCPPLHILQNSILRLKTV